MSTTERGAFVTFEGLDGCGKTTQMRLLAERLRAEGRTVVETVEPGGTAIGSAIRSILLDARHAFFSDRAEMLLYFAARAQNVDEILEPALARGDIVLSDRWTDSTVAYQGYGRGLGVEVVRELDRIACRGRVPHLTIWIDLDLATGLDRVTERNAEAQSENRMDTQAREFYARVREGYQALAAAEPARFRRVDGSGGIEEVAARVWQVWLQFRSGHV